MDLSNPQSLNRYAYVGGNPTNYSDPFGLEMCDIKNSFAECGGWAGIYGGYYGSSYASYMQEVGWLPEESREGYSQYLQMVAGSRSELNGGGAVSCSSTAVATGSCIEVHCDALSEPGDWWCNPTFSFLPVICGSTCGRFIGPNASNYYGAVQIVGQSEVPVTVAAAGALAIPAIFMGAMDFPLLTTAVRPVFQLGRTAVYNPDFISFGMDFLSGWTPPSFVPATWGGAIGVASDQLHSWWKKR